MIIVKVKGGLGNQLYQYAFARELQYRGKDVFLDTSAYNRVEMSNGFELDRLYKLKTKTADNKDTRRLLISANYFFQRVLRKLFKNYKKKFIRENTKIYSDSYKELDNVYIDGYWQNERYFSKVAPDLREELLAIPVTGNNQNLQKEIELVESVGIHVRRGDYLNLPLYSGICDLPYYTRAIEYIKTISKNPQFYIFSNDMEWCKANLPVENAVFVEGNTGLNSIFDMILMSSCKYNIIANSSFSWWGAWLNKKKKAVIAPAKWYNNKKRDAAVELSADWIRI